MSDKDKAHAAPDVETPATDLPDVETPREEASDAVLGEAAEASNFDFASAFNAEFGDEVGGETLGGDETITALITQIGDLSAERDDLKDKLMRSLAEAENTRRRAERDRKDAEAMAGPSWRAICWRCTTISTVRWPAPTTPRANMRRV